MRIELDLTEIDICAVHDLTVKLDDKLKSIAPDGNTIDKNNPYFDYVDRNYIQDLKEQLAVLMKIENAL